MHTSNSQYAFLNSAYLYYPFCRYGYLQDDSAILGPTNALPNTPGTQTSSGLAPKLLDQSPGQSFRYHAKISNSKIDQKRMTTDSPVLFRGPSSPR